MRIDDFIREVENIAPLELQESWDNSGIQIRAGNNEISKVLVALEINERVIDEAIGAGADMILTHHPLIFREIKSVDSNDVIGNHIVKLIRRGISVYSSHTPFDKCIGGNNDYLGSILGIEDIGPMPGDESAICRIGSLASPMTCAEFLSTHRGFSELRNNSFNLREYRMNLCRKSAGAPVRARNFLIRPLRPVVICS